MKLKISIAIVLLSTAALIGVISLVLSKTSQPPTEAKVAMPYEEIGEEQEKAGQEKPIARKPIEVIRKDMDAPEKDPTEEVIDEDEDEPEQETKLSPEDVQKINQVASLSETDLSRELDTLRARIEEDDLFTKLEDGELSEREETEAKETLERFALLGLEGTRRKYMNAEPELKDALYAHRESLKEIRELLNDEE